MNFTHCDQEVAIDIARLAIAGWAGRDSEAVQHHIEELAAIGVAPPSQTPLFYRCSVGLLTQDEHTQVFGRQGSGEIEICLISDETSRLWLTVASDYTDRELEAWSVAHSKQLCVKPLGREIWALDEVIEHWDSLILESRIDDGVVYQHGQLSALLDVDTLISKLPGELVDESGQHLRPGTALFCGTLPVSGAIRFSERFDMTLTDPIRQRHLTHGYRLHILPVVS
ncbi:DUF2848 family protein [Kushneria aurantia]|uniref:DUF2848 family protein n=1 Tax=Kushneria aurantia TaxID=504092 RepID=A0ABV6G4X9_9GAMM|nr:DUF2848 family protein [Kushneria aurantia]